MVVWWTKPCAWQQDLPVEGPSRLHVEERLVGEVGGQERGLDLAALREVALEVARVHLQLLQGPWVGVGGRGQVVDVTSKR